MYVAQDGSITAHALHLRHRCSLPATRTLNSNASILHHRSVRIMKANLGGSGMREQGWCYIISDHSVLVLVYSNLLITNMLDVQFFLERWSDLY